MMRPVPRRRRSLADALADLSAALAAVRTRAAGLARPIDRLLADADAARFHATRGDHGDLRPTLVAVVGGTGTGKSTLVNRLLGRERGREVTAASFRRTFTAGPVAVAKSPADLPPGWPGIPHQSVTPDAPPRGTADVLTVVTADAPLLETIVLTDTPDLDGDRPAHHAQADRLFRWADAVAFVVTPEKYQLPDLPPYYKLAARYRTPALFVMNKAEEAAVVEDYETQLAELLGESPAARAFAIRRDDSTFAPPRGLDELRDAAAALRPAQGDERRAGLAARAADLAGRLRDQVLDPLRAARRRADAAAASVRALQAPEPGVDVHPMTWALQRRLQQRSVLYLMGPGRIVDRLISVPSLLARLPRTAWDLARGKPAAAGDSSPTPPRDAPDFPETLADQFRVVQSRIDDALAHSNLVGGDWKLDPARAAAVATEELDDLRRWLEERWNGTPRDTAALNKLLKFFPGAEKLTKYSEAAPYLLTAATLSVSAVFGHVDQIILGGYTLATWLGERLSNEVAARTRRTNKRISDRFGDLADEQISRALAWIETQAPTDATLDELEALAESLVDD